MSAAAGWGEGLAPLIQNLSNISGTGDRAREAALDDDYRYGLQKAANYSKYDLMGRVEGAKAAGLHPLAALGMSPSSHSSPVVASGTEGMSHAMSSISRNQNSSLERRLLTAQVRAAESDADLTVQQNNAAIRNLSTQPGTRPAALTEIVPRRITASIPGQPATAGGQAPTNAGYTVTDAWSAQPREVIMPTQDFGSGIENLGELWQAVLGTPFALDVLYQKYLQTPREWVTDRLFDAHTAGRRADEKYFKRQKLLPKFLQAERRK